MSFTNFSIQRFLLFIFQILFFCFLLSGCDKTSKKTQQEGSRDPIAVIDKVTNKQFTITKQVNVKENGLTAYIAQPKQAGQPIIFYGNQKTGEVFYGLIFDKDGNNLTEKYTNLYIKPMLATKIFETVKSAHDFLIGKKDAQHQIYMVAEPNCSICNKLYSNLKPYVDRGELSIRWIMTAFLHPSSTNKAAAILQAQDPVKALNDVESQSNKDKVTTTVEATKETKKILEDNLKFMQENGITGTPVIFYYDKNHKPQRVDGYPQQSLDHLIKEIGMLTPAPPLSLAEEPVSSISAPAKKQDAKKTETLDKRTQP